MADEYNISYTDGVWNSPQLSGPRRLLRPFADDGDHNIYIYEEDYTQRIDTIVPVPIGLAGDSPYVLIEERDVVPIGGGMGKWTRAFARTPGNRIRWESHAWREPGMSPDVSPFPVGIGTATNSGGNTIITTTAEHGLEIGDYALISYNIKFNDGTAETTHTIIRQVLGLTSKTTFQVDVITEKVVSWHSVREAGGRSPTTKVVTSKVELEYFTAEITGALYASPEKIPIVEPDRIQNALNEETDTYAPTTSPTLSEYKDKVSAKSWLVAEASIIRRWRGPIYERATRYVRAQ